MPSPDFDEITELICKEDKRYAPAAYGFVRQGLDHTVKELKKNGQDQARASRHVNGRELLNGLRQFGLEQFGPMTKVVLNEWGVRRCGDFGEIVFNLIEYDVFSKTAEDSRSDFADAYEFDDAFVKPFLPGSRRRRRGKAPGKASAPKAS